MEYQVRKKGGKWAKVKRKQEVPLVYRSVGLEVPTYVAIDAIEIKGFRGISGKFRYLINLGLKQYKKEHGK